jgi:DNA-binding transcriptional ArsR family regulator
MPPAATLDETFHALAHPARRAVVERLGRGTATVSELAAPFDMALPSFLEHLRVLEAAGIVTSRKNGRVRTVRLRPKELRSATEWLARQRELWDRRLDQLDAYAKELKGHNDDGSA